MDTAGSGLAGNKAKQTATDTGRVHDKQLVNANTMSCTRS